MISIFLDLYFPQFFSQIGLFLRSQGAKYNSQLLVQLADKIAEDPFAKVKSMIKEMISKIQKQLSDAQETDVSVP